MNDITSILHQFKKGLLSAEEAAEKIRAGTVPAPSHTDIDYSRLERTGCPEVIYGAGKTPDQIEEIARSLLAAGQNVLATRLNGEALDYLNRAFPAADMHPEARLMRIAPNPVPRTAGFVGIVSAGTSDQYVAEEAALTAEFLGSRVVRYRDCGVAGLHRLVSHLDSIRQATALVAVAGMEGALPCDSRAYQRGLWSQFPRGNHPARHDEFLRQRCFRRQHRQRLRGRFQRPPDQQPGIPAQLRAACP